MPRTEGGSKGFSGGGGRAMTMSRGGVGLAERSGFSSRGLAAFKAPERPRLALGTPKPPQLSFEGSKFKSEKVYTPKNPGVFSADGFRGNRPTPRRVERPVSSPRVNRPIRSRTIENVSILPKIKSESVANRNWEPKRIVRPNEGLVTQQNLDRAVPFIVPGLDRKPVQAPASLPRTEFRPKISPNTPERKTPEAIRFAQPIKEVPSVKPAQIEIVRREMLAPKPIENAFQITRQELQTKPQVRVESFVRPENPVMPSSRTEAFRQFAIAPAKKVEEKPDEAQVELVAKAYVTAGLAQTQEQGVQLTRQYLQNEKPKAKVEAKIATQTATITETKEKVLVQNAVKVQKEQQVAVETQQQAKEILKEKSQKLVANNSRTKALRKKFENPFKVDQLALKSRVQQLREAIRTVFPVMQPEHKVSLKEVAQALKAPDKSTESGAVEQLQLTSDGSETAWRKPIYESDELVTKSEAKAMEINIYQYLPVVLKDDGLAAKEKDVAVVLSGKSKEEYVKAA